MPGATTIIAALAPLVVAIALLTVTLAVAKRYLASMGIPAGWVSIPRIVRALWRVTIGSLFGLWRASRSASRFIQGRRTIRRLPSRVSIASSRRKP
jgi:hypothetical protein